MKAVYVAELGKNGKLFIVVSDDQLNNMSGNHIACCITAITGIVGGELEGRVVSAAISGKWPEYRQDDRSKARRDCMARYAVEQGCIRATNKLRSQRLYRAPC